MQSRRSSLIEAVLNTLIGFVISLGIGLLVLPHYGVKPDLAINVQITLIFTLSSLIRSYLLRRYFNSKIHRLAERLAN